MIVQFEKITFIKFKDRDSLINQLMLHMEPAFTESDINYLM